MARQHRRGHARRAPTAPRSSWRASAAPSRCSTPTCTSRGGNFASRLPQPRSRSSIRKHGLRNSHLLSIAPTGTISLAFADNARNGIEPPFSWTYTRKKRMADGTLQGIRGRGPRLAPVPPPGRRRTRRCPPSFVTALEISAQAHEEMVAAVAPFIDTAISQDRQRAGRLPLRRLRGPLPHGLAVGPEGPGHLPAEHGARLGAVGRAQQPKAEGEKRGRRTWRSTAPTGAWRSSACPRRCSPRCAGPAGPRCPPATSAWTYMIEHPARRVRALRRPLSEDGKAGAFPFEVWVNGAEQPRGLGAVAKTLSMDMRANDRAWLTLKLDALADSRRASESFEMPFPPHGEKRLVPGRGRRPPRQVIRWRCEQLGALESRAPTLRPRPPTRCSTRCSAATSRSTGTDGTLAWTVDMRNPATGEDFVLGLKEMHALPDGASRGPTRCGSRATTRARSTAWRGCCRSTCA